MSEPITERTHSSYTQMPTPTVDSRHRSRHEFSVVHMLAAARFSRLTRDAEARGDRDEILQLTVACVTSTVAALEACANEIYFDQATNFPNHNSDLLKSLWQFIETRQTLEKLDFALTLRNRPALNRGRRPYQDVAALIKLRNAVVHFKSEWEDEPTTHAKVTAQLQNKYVLDGNVAPVFTQRWASHTCTEWAVSKTLSLIAGFEQQAGFPDTFGQFSSSLTL